jgi:EpsI family protein
MTLMMLNFRKSLVVILLLLSTIVISLIFPENKYTGTNFLSTLTVPYKIPNWQGKDVKETLNLNSQGTTADFISNLIAYQYVNDNGTQLFFIILDAGNFHNPKTCFTSAGYKIKELPDTEIHISDHTFKSHTVYIERGKDSYVSTYWIIIDNKIVHEWIEQKLKQLYFSMFNKKRIGLMVRIDIPARENTIDNALLLTNQFVSALHKSLPPEKADYIFGKFE